MGEAGSGESGGYVAFISYSHKDAEIGRWLHRKLETYRLPKRLAGVQGEQGEVPARLTPIFRDRDELPAAGDLSEKVRAALAVSRNLIIVCSSHSAASPWVAKEIATFRELHPGRPIFTAIVEGEPDRCFAPPLREGGIEPLAADLRKEGDGRRLGLLKLVAGLAGVGLDDLVQRDAARRIRRVSYVTAAAIVAMVAMALLTAFAIDARTEAQRQRSQAEGLVEFMLTDLRKELKGVASLKVLTAANHRALEYYQNQGDLSKLPDDSLERRARVLHAIGEDDEQRGNLGNALSLFREAHAATAAALARHRNDPKAIFAHAQSEYWIGRIHELRQDWRQAGLQYARYAAAAEQLIRLDPGNPDYMMEMGWGAMNQGVVRLKGLSSPAAAQLEFERAADWFARAAVSHPDRASALREEANAHGSVAETFYTRRQWTKALQAYEKQYAISVRILRLDPGNAQDGFRVAIAERAVARLRAILGDNVSSGKLLAQSYERSAQLVARDPENAEWRLFKAKIECNIVTGAPFSSSTVSRKQALKQL